MLPCAVEEMLRWVSPIKNMTRTVTRDLELAGPAIPAGDKVLLLYESANCDARAFDEPERFDVERTPNDHLAFGFGPHFCLGASLARLELQMMFDGSSRAPRPRARGPGRRPPAPARRLHHASGAVHADRSGAELAAPPG